MNNKLYVGNLSYDTTESTLRELFAKSGNIRSVNVIMDRMTNQPRGFAFVEMETPAEALKAIQMYDGQDVDGRSLKVNEAKPMENRSSGGSSGGKNSNRRY
jgi:RNA recognition motif-containing protein